MDTENNVSNFSEQEIASIEKCANELSLLRQAFDIKRYEFLPQDYAVMKNSLSQLGKYVDSAQPVTFSSHRRLLGPVIIKVKNLIAKALHPILRQYFMRQIMFNSHVWNMGSMMAILEERMIALEQQVKELKQMR